MTEFFDVPPVPKDIKRWGSLTILQHYLYLWEPRDARLSEEYTRHHEVYQYDIPELIPLADGMYLSVISKIPQKDALIVGVYFTANQAEMEKLKNTINKRFDTWERNGSPEDVFDPVSGDIHQVRIFDDLKDIKPVTALYVRLRLSLEILENSYKLSFSAIDKDDTVLYYNILEDKNPGYLLRRAIHELFGNLFLKGNEGPFLEGIVHLIQGKKTKLCRDNQKPEWLIHSQIKNSNPKLKQNQVLTGILDTLAFLLTYLIPFTWFIWGVIFNVIDACKAERLDGFLLRMSSSLAGIIVSFGISRMIIQYNDVLKLKSKLT